VCNRLLFWLSLGMGRGKKRKGEGDREWEGKTFHYGFLAVNCMWVISPSTH
jgi:hypothetical protein